MKVSGAPDEFSLLRSSSGRRRALAKYDLPPPEPARPYIPQQDETGEERRKARLEKRREYDRNYFANETPEKRERRLALQRIVDKRKLGVEVWTYGSRVGGRSHDGSDLDLVLRGPNLEKIPTSQLTDFEEAMRESTIPFLVEARNWARLPERFHQEIVQNHVVLDIPKR